MAQDFDELAIILTARFDQLEAGLKAAQEKITAFHRKSGEETDLVTKKFLGMAAAVGLTGHELLRYASEALEAGIQSGTLAAALEAVENNLNLSKPEVDAQVTSMKNLGFTGAAASDVLLKLTQAHIDVNKATILAAAANDIAATSGGDYNQKLEELTQAVIRAQPRLLAHALGISRVESGTQRYADSLGKNAENLTTAENRQAAFNIVMDAARQVQGSYNTMLESGVGNIVRFNRESAKTKEALGELETGPLNALAGAWLNTRDAISKANAATEEEIKNRKTSANVNLEDAKSLNDLIGNSAKASDGIADFSLRVRDASEESKNLKKQAAEVTFHPATVSLDEAIKKFADLDSKIKDFGSRNGEAIKQVLVSLHEQAVLQDLTTDEEIKNVRKAAASRILSDEETHAFARKIRELEFKDAVENVKKLHQVEKQFSDAMAQSFTALTGLFGKTAADIGAIWSSLIEQMAQKLISSAIFDLLSKAGSALISSLIPGGGVAGVALGAVAGGKGFDDPSNDMGMQSLGSKWFADALSNFSKGYVNQALTSPMTAPVMAAALGGGGSTVYNINPSFPSVVNLSSPSQMRQAGIIVGNLIKSSGAGKALA